VVNQLLLDIIAFFYFLCNNMINIIPGDAHFIFISTCQIILAHGIDFIGWPEENEYRSISEDFRLPYTIGSVVQETT
jgi:hypothetical protein